MLQRHTAQSILSDGTQALPWCIRRTTWFFLRAFPQLHLALMCRSQNIVILLDICIFCCSLVGVTRQVEVEESPLCRTHVECCRRAAETFTCFIHTLNSKCRGLSSHIYIYVYPIIKIISFCCKESILYRALGEPGPVKIGLLLVKSAKQFLQINLNTSALLISC